MIGVTAANNALTTAILIVFTIAVLVFAGGLFSQKSSYAIMTEAGYIVAMALVLIVCQGIL